MMNIKNTDRETRMNSRHLIAFVHTGLSLCLMGTVPATWGADSFTATTGAEKTSKTQKAKKAKAPKPPTHPGTGESPAERKQRLLRECQGKVNAGACEGYAR
jgi:hypothetical protein